MIRAAIYFRTSHGSTECSRIYARNGIRGPRHLHAFHPHNNLAPALPRHASSLDINSFGSTARDEPALSTTTSTQPDSSSTSLTTVEDHISVSPLFSMQSLDFPSGGSHSFHQEPKSSPGAGASSGLTPLPMNPFSPYIGNDFTSLTNINNKDFDFHQPQDVAQQLDQIMNMSFLDFAQYTPGPATDTFSSSPSFSASPPSDMSPFETRWGPPPNRFVWTKLDEGTWAKLLEQLTDEKQVPRGPLFYHCLYLCGCICFEVGADIWRKRI